jgi:hypothetical protein
MNIGMESSCGCANWCAVAGARRSLLNAKWAAKKASGVFWKIVPADGTIAAHSA